MICLVKSALSVEGFTIWALTKPLSLLCHCKGFHIIYLDDILVLVHSKWAGKRAYSFLCSSLVWLRLHINFSLSDLCLMQTTNMQQYVGSCPFYPVYHSPNHLFSFAQFSFPPYISLNSYLICNRAQFHCNFHFLMWLLLLMPCYLIRPFIFRDLVYLFCLVDPGQVLCVGLILRYRSFRPLL